MSRPRVLVALTPYVYATALADCLGLNDACDVIVPDLAAGEEPDGGPYRVVVTTAAGPVGRTGGEIIITLPARSWDEPLLVTVDGRTAPVVAGERRGLELLLRLVRHYADAAPAPHAVAAWAPERVTG